MDSLRMSPENGVSKDLNYRVKWQRLTVPLFSFTIGNWLWNIDKNLFNALLEEVFDIPKTVADMKNELCKGSWHYRICTKRMIIKQTVFLTSQLISISFGKWPSILIFSGFSSGAVEKKKNIDFVANGKKSEQTHKREDFQQKWNQLCGRSECFYSSQRSSVCSSSSLKDLIKKL